jgi:hypothetical protein
MRNNCKILHRNSEIKTPLRRQRGRKGEHIKINKYGLIM